ncbi:acetyl-CoA carboxylase biotin carboxyl carrier protein subunit [Sediminicoccus sp. KRV36]|uniref:acetyl-CoA carboxylase biotin carboxyl carrier protein subunit n=1 Tax=Sediminicoccus sp. KRV36 TaxID=3133721 RepID=UPI00200D9B15|nr:acetyl-CoA carboxylase biotin carboxyl carrier protein subunit [Sediminicoccus rosea]UPY35726.1 acetyl-CoA carboxylase biotin carboxyl carrier protein subunit [Sediminicoccus rosea]
MAETLVTIRAEIGASVWKITAPAGTVLAEDEPIVILESMKMEIPIQAPYAGVVIEILVVEGQQVEEGQAVATFRA